MSEYGKRKSRKENRCNSIVNPLHSKETALDLQRMLPAFIRSKLTNQYFDCSHIQRLPELSLASSHEEMENALERMKIATEWQKKSLQSHGSKQKKNEKVNLQYNEYSIFDQSKERNLQRRQQICVQGEKSIYSALLEGELQEFIMNPPPANYDFEFQCEAPYFYVPISNHDLSYPNDFHDFDL